MGCAKWPGMYGLKVMENLTAVNVGPGRLPFLPTSDAAKADLKARVKGWCATLCRGEGSRAAMVRKADNGQPVSQQDNARSGEVTIEWWCARWVAL